MRIIKKKILSVVLTCAMVVSLFVGVSPMRVSAMLLDEITITKQPEDVTVEMGDRATFTVEAESKLDLSYQWEVDYGSGFRNADGLGTTSATYTTYSTDASFIGSKYRCVITTESGRVTSDEVTLTINIQRPTEATGVSIKKTVDGYTVTGIEDEDGYRWGYYPYKLGGEEVLENAVAGVLNRHLTNGPWEHELANLFNGSYEITSYTILGGDPESLDNYDYIEIVKLDESWMIREVAVLPLPKTIEPEYPYGDDIVDLGDDSITIDENNIPHFDIPEDDEEYLYLTMVIPTMLLGDVMTADEYIEMLEKGVGEPVIDVPGTLSMENVAYNTELQESMTIYILSNEMWYSSETVGEEITSESVVCLIKLHKDNCINTTYESSAENDYFEGLSDKAYIYAVYGVHAELVTPTGGGSSSGTLVDPIDIQLDWDELPTLEVGMDYDTYPEIEENPLTITGTGIDEYVEVLWGVKVTESHKITEDDEYYDELVEEWGAQEIANYNEYLDYVIDYCDGWTALTDLFDNPYYCVNEDDTYALLVYLCSQDGYIFGEESYMGFEYEGEVTGNVEVVSTIGFMSTELNLFLKLGTLAEMEESKNPSVVAVPEITGQPQDVSVATGKTATFKVTATGENLTYKWQINKNDGKGFVAIEGAISATYTTDVVDVNCNGYKYQCVVSNEGGEVTSATATLTVTVPPTSDDGDDEEENVPSEDVPEDDGSLEKDAEVAPDAPIADATLDNSKDELLDAENIFNETEKQQIKDGADAKVWLEISKSEADDITADDKAEIEREVAKIMGDKLNLTYFNADLFKQVGNGPATPVSKPGIAIKVTIVIPEDLLNSDASVERVYKIVRLHDGKVDVLSGDFNAETGEFTFETDRFSPYAIAYVDSPIENGGTVESPDAGDCNRTVALIMFMAISGALAFVCVRRKVTINDEI